MFNLKISRKERQEMLSALVIGSVAMATLVSIFFYMLDRAIRIEDQFRREQVNEALKMYHQVAKP